MYNLSTVDCWYIKIETTLVKLLREMFYYLMLFVFCLNNIFLCFKLPCKSLHLCGLDGFCVNIADISHEI